MNKLFEKIKEKAMRPSGVAGLAGPYLELDIDLFAYMLLEEVMHTLLINDRGAAVDILNNHFGFKE